MDHYKQAQIFADTFNFVEAQDDLLDGIAWPIWGLVEQRLELPKFHWIEGKASGRQLVPWWRACPKCHGKLAVIEGRQMLYVPNTRMRVPDQPQIAVRDPDIGISTSRRQTS